MNAKERECLRRFPIRVYSRLPAALQTVGLLFLCGFLMTGAIIHMAQEYGIRLAQS